MRRGGSGHASESYPSLRVLMVNDDLQVGGIQRLIAELAGELSDLGHHVDVFAAPGGWFERDLPAASHLLPAHRRGGALPWLHNVRRLRAALRHGRYDVVHSHQRGLGLAANIAQIGLRTVVVEHVHNQFDSTPLTRLLSYRGSLIVGCGTRIAAMLRNDFRIRPERVRAILNSINTDDPRAATPVKSPNDRKLLLSVGRLDEQKDPLRFLRVVKELDRTSPGVWRAVWLGDGPLRLAVEEESRRLDIADLVTFPGNTRDVRPWMERATLLLLTSRHEGLPLVGIEALAAGLPLCIPDVGSCVDLFYDHVGMLYEPDIGDDELACAIANADSTAQINAWASACKQAYRDRFTWQQTTPQWIEAYNDALADVRPAV